MIMPDDSSGRLDPLLRAWARQQRLDQHESDEILHAITGQPRESLPATWWADLHMQISDAVVLAAARPSAPVGMSGAALVDTAA